MAVRRQEYPPDCGQRLLSTLIDEYATQQPDRTFVAIPKSTDLRDGWKDISYLTYARAINWCSWWIEENLGNGQNFETISYMGPLDLRYLIILIAAVKTGYTIFFASNRNSLNAHLSLLESTRCNILVVAEEGAPIVHKQVLSKRPMRSKIIPSLDTFLELDDNVVHYPYTKTFAEARLDPLIIMHTSGSTGFPKPVFVKHGTWAAMDAYQMIPPGDEGPLHSDYLRGKRVFLNLPLFHGACECFIYGMGVYGGAIPLLAPPGPRTAEVMDMAHKYGNVFGSIAPPSVLKDLYESPKLFENVYKRVDFLGFAGGSLSKEIGDLISKEIKVIGFFGSTETAYLPCRISEVDDWMYYNYSDYLGHQYRPRRDGRHEMIIVRDPNLDLYQSIFSTFPKLSEYSTADLYEQHPTKPGYWAHRGRADDIIAFSSGEKTNPISFEETMAAHPEVRAAFVGGNNEFQASLLIEPRIFPTSKQEEASLIDSLWPTVQIANRDCPAHARVLKNFVMLAKPDKPFPRAGKDTIQRASIPHLYAEEFEELYRPKKAHSIPEEPAITIEFDGDLRSSLRQLIATNSWLQGELDNQVDFFEAGLDSLQLPKFIDQINSLLTVARPGLDEVSRTTIFVHSSIEKLASYLESK